MRWNSLKSLSLSFALLGGATAFAQDGQLYDFQVGILGVSQAGGFHDAFSFDVHWTPSLSRGSFAVRGDLGFSVLNASSPGTSAKNKFASFSCQVFGEFLLINNLLGSLGGGFQSWLDHESMKPMLSAQMSMLIVEAPLLSRVYIGASRFYASQPVWQWYFGVGLRFD